ncbi:MAG: hypothetical protein M3R15_18495 [Acidobacteriota bacterium]|nr:hypothetical protein [Acidobacteriota bacterium]
MATKKEKEQAADRSGSGQKGATQPTGGDSSKKGGGRRAIDVKKKNFWR